jgi:3-oxoacyl-[acyl-carrier-protein] synthase-3
LGTVRATLEVLGLSMEKTHWVADRFGYAGSASVFMALYDALEKGRLSPGDLVAFCTSGAGFVLSTALFRWV